MFNIDNNINFYTSTIVNFYLSPDTLIDNEVNNKKQLLKQVPY